MRRGRGRLTAALITAIMLIALVLSWSTAALAWWEACSGAACESHWQVPPPD